MKKRSLKIRPYARLLTMLGEQLIKNERIALIELLKNSYDADATWVKVTFENFDVGFSVTESSRIIIEDDGCGMTTEVIEKHWLNPATPEKKIRRKSKPRTNRGRILQGEKGIGRFAILKLGRVFRVITRPKKEQYEHVVSYDFSAYDDQFLSKDGVQKELFLSDLDAKVWDQPPEFIKEQSLNLNSRNRKRPIHGTRIEISNLKGTWSERKIKAVYHDIARLRSLFEEDQKQDFEVFVYNNQSCLPFQEDQTERLKILLEQRAVFSVTDGYFSVDERKIRFRLNGENLELSIDSPELTGLFSSREQNVDLSRIEHLECGPFSFGFYIFDLSPQAAPKHQLDDEDKRTLRAHRIYLYRDGIRVYPYGEPDDDWLRIDAYRGTISAGHFLSNDQVVGYVKISQAQNPYLTDKTNREGLIEHGDAALQFIGILKTILAYLRQKPYARYRLGLADKARYEQNVHKTDQVQTEFEQLKDALKHTPKIQAIAVKAEKSYKAERSYLKRRAETTEQLAGVGLSVESASHDIMAIMGKVFSTADSLLKDLLTGSSLDRKKISEDIQSVRGGLSFIQAQLKDIQVLFASSKQRRKKVKVEEAVEKVERIYRQALKTAKIDYYLEKHGSPLYVKTTDAVLLQLLINLFDNAIYWLRHVNKLKKEIRITLDGSLGTLVFSDNGPGISNEDRPYIFEPFYSGKGEEGRGLGLYIAKQLLERSDFAIDIADIKSERILAGANFVVNFFQEN